MIIGASWHMENLNRTEVLKCNSDSGANEANDELISWLGACLNNLMSAN